MLPVEQRALDVRKQGEPDSSFDLKRKSKLSARHMYATVEEALSHCLPGDTIMLGTGHYWENFIDIRVPVRLISSSSIHDSERCIVEISKQIRISPSARSVLLCGISIRHPRKTNLKLSCVAVESSKLMVGKKKYYFYITTRQVMWQGVFLSVVQCPWGLM